MLSRAIISDESLLGYAVFLSMSAMVLFVLAGLGVFAYSEGRPAAVEQAAEKRLPLGARPAAPVPTTITLTEDGAMLVNTNPFPREEVDLVFAEMLLKKPTPPLIVHCERGVRPKSFLEILGRARAAGIQDVRLVVTREME